MNKKIPKRLDMYCPLTNELVDTKTMEHVDADDFEVAAKKTKKKTKSKKV